MQGWRMFWSIFCGIGFASFVVLVLVIIPRGAVELKELFATLESERDTIHDSEERSEQSRA